MTRNFDKSINMGPKMMSASTQLSWFPSASSLLGFEDLINFLTLKDTPTTEEKTRAPPVAAQLGDAQRTVVKSVSVLSTSTLLITPSPKDRKSTITLPIPL